MKSAYLVKLAAAAVVAAASSASAATYYVATTGNDATGDGSQGNPYASPAKALSRVTANDDTIYFAPGTYTFSEPAVISNKNVRLIGAEDRSVIFDGQNQTRILVESGSGAFTGIELSGITFRNGRYSDSNENYAQMRGNGGAVRLVGPECSPDWSNTGSIVTNCAFYNCSSAYSGGGGLFVGGGSTVVDCIF